MTVTHQLNTRGTHPFYPQGFGRWLRVASDNYSDGLLGFLVAPAWAALSPSLVVVDGQAKVSFSRFKFNRRSNPFNALAELTNRSVQPVSAPIQLIITLSTRLKQFFQSV